MISRIQALFSMNPMTNSVAAGAVISPFWLPYLQTTSDVAGMLLPVAGLVWLLIQMYFFVRKNK